MTKIQRVRKVCKWLIFMDYAENDTELAVKMGYTKSSFSQIMNEKVPLSDKFINSLVKIDENINIVWINDEEGKMLRSEEIALKNDDCSDKIEIISYQKEIIAMLKEKLDGCDLEKKPTKTIV